MMKYTQVKKLLSSKKSLGFILSAVLVIGVGIAMNKTSLTAAHFVEVTYKAQSPFGQDGGSTVPASCESGTTNWNENGAYHLDGVSSKPGAIGTACTKTLPDDGQCGVTLTNTGTTVAADTSCTASCTAAVPTLPDARCSDAAVNLRLFPSVIAYNGSYRLSYTSQYVINNSCTLNLVDGGVSTGEVSVPNSFNFGTVSNNLGPNTKTWTLSCRSSKTGAMVSDTKTLRVKSECESISCTVPSIPGGVGGGTATTTMVNGVCGIAPGVYKTSSGGYIVVDAACTQTPLLIGQICIDPVSHVPSVCPHVVNTGTISTATLPTEIASFTVRPKLISKGGGSTLRWKIDNMGVASCKIYNTKTPSVILKNIGAAEAVSSLVVTDINEKTIYTIDCGAGKTADVAVSVYNLTEF